ncbi:TPA: hypothetical protein ACWL6U_001120 [Morganella morganii]
MMMADKKEDIRTPDIHDYLINRNLESMSTGELRKLCNTSNDVSYGLMRGLKTMGELAFWACDSENYSDTQAKDGLRGIGECLMYLPRIVEALNINAENAQFLIYQREGFPFAEVNNGEH